MICASYVVFINVFLLTTTRSLPSPQLCAARIQMNNSPRGSDAHLRSPSPECTSNDRCNSLPRGTKIQLVSVPSPSDPTRQARRLPIRILKMLSTHSSILLHPEYLQPLTSAPVSIEVSKAHFLELSNSSIILDRVNVWNYLQIFINIPRSFQDYSCISLRIKLRITL